ncbi:bifunctional UDP-N-acetylglucosamine diphosphorylase/glucosamine-1-phosphate N-acetyltransferase GlmU [Oceanibacterium hippocampi]|uniref:Bifunctional protein GlmU n=1 Tax=Oceanibacterium hippocampi TaxID=745714 RepID=A0A1Y5T8X2_9PROT|nr:bifunctional UDP-N-acetylglucosamine diphosphorylase/glucosamine-1-phosphate N-acetyltransferase GlmU [Oceanibacterium hippocampi]SLN56642.1 Bifunctional protein GlmU [Oceanibacterium hippocampi]
MNKLAAIVLAAGQGTRMKSGKPKVLHEIAGRPMVSHLVASLAPMAPDPVVLVVAPTMKDVEAAVPGAHAAIQDPPLGTAHAVLAARQWLEGFDGDVLVLFGDTPLIRPATLEAMLKARRAADNPAVVVLGFRPDDPKHYGRLVTGASGELQAIVEYVAASEEERAIRLCNSGVMALDGKRALALLDAVTNDNPKGEYFLTDVVAIARRKGWSARVVEGTERELLGVNSRAELAEAETIVQQQLRAAAMAAGVSLIAPETVWLSHDTVLGADVTVEPNVWFGPGVTVGEGTRIRAFSHLEGARVDAGCEVGPYARLRPGATLARGAKVGNFVEVKKADIGPGAKVNHLSYIGDAEIGAKANIGAGTITCNYDGFFKYRTVIGAGAFIGSNTALIAPVTVGEGAVVGAGSAISKDVAADELAVTRAPQTTRKGWAAAFRDRKSAEKKGV